MKIEIPESTELLINEEKRQQEAIATLGAYALEEDNLASIIHRALQLLCLGTGVDYAFLFRWHAREEMFTICNSSGWKPNKQYELEIKEGTCRDIERALYADKPLVVESYKQEQGFSLFPLLKPLQIMSGVHLRIVESNRKRSSVLSLYSTQRRSYTAGDLSFLRAVSSIVGMASERERRELSLEKEVQRCKRLQQQILKNSIAERWDLGAYLHDNLAQSLAAVKVLVIRVGKQLEDPDLSLEMDHISEELQSAIEGVRDLTHEIIPVDIEEEGVEHALRLLVRELQKSHDINCRLDTDRVIEKIRDKKVATNLYHVIQEAVKNAATHGNAGNVTISVTEEKEQLTLRITDDGSGLSQGEDKESRGSGTNIMRHRMELLGGTFDRKEITDDHSTGTVVVCTLPLRCLKESEVTNEGER